MKTAGVKTKLYALPSHTSHAKSCQFCKL